MNAMEKKRLCSTFFCKKKFLFRFLDFFLVMPLNSCIFVSMGFSRLQLMHKIFTIKSVSTIKATDTYKNDK